MSAAPRSRSAFRLQILTHTHIWNSTGLDWSSTSSVTLRLRRVPAAPGQPTNLAAEANGSTQIDLTWEAPADDGGSAITGYRIEVSTDGGTNWDDLEADTGKADTKYSHTGLSPGDTRHYRVSAINATGTSVASGSDDATTIDPPTLSSAQVGFGGERIVLDFSENLDTFGGSEATRERLLGQRRRRVHRGGQRCRSLAPFRIGSSC